MMADIPQMLVPTAMRAASRAGSRASRPSHGTAIVLGRCARNHSARMRSAAPEPVGAAADRLIEHVEFVRILGVAQQIRFLLEHEASLLVRPLGPRVRGVDLEETHDETCGPAIVADGDDRLSDVVQGQLALVAAVGAIS